MAKYSYCHGNLFVLYCSRATQSACIVLGSTCRFDLDNFLLCTVELTLQSVVSVVIFFLASALSYLLFRDMGRFTWAYYVIFTIDFTFSYL